MSVLRIDVMSAPSSVLLRMNSDIDELRGRMDPSVPVTRLKEAATEVAAEINRRLPIPGARASEAPDTWRAATHVAQDATKTAVLALAFEIAEHWRTQEGLNGQLLDRLAELTSTDDGPKCAAQGRCACRDGCGACDGCGRWLEEEMQSVRKRVRAELIKLLQALDETDPAIIPEDRFDPEIDAIIYAARGI